MPPWLSELKFTKAGIYDVPNQPLRGRSVTILGGGPSLTSAVAWAVQIGPVIATNNAYMLTRGPALVVAMDKRWLQWHRQSLQAAGHVVVTALREGATAAYAGALWAMRKESDQIWPTTKDALSGHNSGHAAVALAYHLGAKQVFLAGFDMGFVDGKSHWHSGHQIPASEGNYVNRFRPALEKLAREGKARGFPIRAVTFTMAEIPSLPLNEALKELGRENSMDYPAPPATL